MINNYTTTSQITPAAHSAYDLPILEALVRYMHTVAGFPVKSTWLKSTKKGNFATWPGLTYSNAARYCPQTVETIKEHMVQPLQGVISTKKKKHQSRDNKKAPVQVTLEKDYEKEDILPPLKKKNSTSGINTSVNSTLMIVGDYRVDTEVVMST